jgi:hypothetical protein
VKRSVARAKAKVARKTPARKKRVTRKAAPQARRHK